MTHSPNVIEREWFALAPDGTEHTLRLGVGPAVLQPRGEWIANVSLGALEPDGHKAVGMDSWQAIDLGMGLAVSVVRHREKQGWQFFWERGGDRATAADLERSNTSLERTRGE